uniref:Uncharacterized protein n=1 Tax=Solanum tuberosum TaxID=4113 RepID=M1ASR7_SOLTU
MDYWHFVFVLGLSSVLWLTNKLSFHSWSLLCKSFPAFVSNLCKNDISIMKDKKKILN